MEATARVMAVDVLRTTPHSRIMTGLQRYHIEHEKPSAAALLNKIAVHITIHQKNAFDVLKDVLVTGRLNEHALTENDLRVLVDFAVSMYKAYPTEAALVQDQHADGDFWHNISADGSQAYWVMCVTKARAKKLDRTGTVKPGFYAIAAGNAAMEKDAVDPEGSALSWLRLFQAFYGIDRRPLFLGDLESIPALKAAATAGGAASGASSAAFTAGLGTGDSSAGFVSTLFSNGAVKDRTKRNKSLRVREPQNAPYFEFHLPNGAALGHGDAKANRLAVFALVSKALMICDKEKQVEDAVAGLESRDPVNGMFKVHLSNVQATHNLGLPHAVTPRSWKLVSVHGQEEFQRTMQSAAATDAAAAGAYKSDAGGKPSSAKKSIKSNPFGQSVLFQSS